jgi:hypothetical protein
MQRNAIKNKVFCLILNSILVVLQFLLHIMAYLFKARIVEPEETFIAREQYGKNT